jgi:hypothetical protein
VEHREKSRERLPQRRHLVVERDTKNTRSELKSTTRARLQRRTPPVQLRISGLYRMGETPEGW